MVYSKYSPILSKFNKIISFQESQSITPTILGRISSYYYLSHLSLRLFREQLHGNSTLPELLKTLSVSIKLKTDSLQMRNIA
jgi:activating signal cointegrator complex subunit 3